MKTKYIPQVLFLFASTVIMHGQVVNDPFYVTGSDAIDPSGRMEVSFTASGSTSESILEGLSGFGAVQVFSGFTGNTQTDGSHIFTFSNSNSPAIRFTFGGNTNTSASAALDGNGSYVTSSTQNRSALRLNPFTGDGNTLTLEIDFGSYASDSFSAAAEGEGVSAVGFTVSGVFKNLSTGSGGISITYLDSLDNVLSSQLLSQNDHVDSTVAGYTGYQISGEQDSIASVLVSFELGDSSAVFGLDDLGFTNYKAVPEPAQTSVGIVAAFIVMFSIVRRSLGRS